MGAFDKTQSVLKTGNLEIKRPPIENLIASKMVRGEDRDYQDCIFLIKKCKLDQETIEQAISTIKDHESRENAKENFNSLKSYMSVDFSVAPKEKNQKKSKMQFGL